MCPRLSWNPSGSVEPSLQLVPDHVLGPAVDVLVGRALEVHPLDVVVPLADQREPAVGVAVDQFLRAGWRFAQDAEPGERVLHEVVGAVLLRDRPFADPAEPSAPTRISAWISFALPSASVNRIFGVSVGQVEHLGVGHRVVDLPAVAFPGGGEVDEHLVLRVQPHRFPDQVGEVDAVALPAEPQVDALVLVPGLENPIGDAGVDEHVDAAVFEDAGPVGGPDRLVVTLFDHDVVDPGLGQQVRQHQAGGAAADDSDSGLDHLRVRHRNLLVVLRRTCRHDLSPAPFKRSEVSGHAGVIHPNVRN